MFAKNRWIKNLAIQIEMICWGTLKSVSKFLVTLCSAGIGTNYFLIYILCASLAQIPVAFLMVFYSNNDTVIDILKPAATCVLFGERRRVCVVVSRYVYCVYMLSNNIQSTDRTFNQSCHPEENGSGRRPSRPLIGPLSAPGP